MNKILISLLLIVFSSVASLASDFNNFYDKAEYSKALELALSQDKLSPEVNYNIGNCYYRLGQKGKAIQYYRKAQVMSPRDKDIKHNILVVKSSLKDKDDLSAGFLAEVWALFLNSFSINEFSFMLLTVYLLLTVLLVFSVNNKKRLVYIVVIAVTAFLLWEAKYFSYNQACGVLIVDNSEILSSPGQNSSVLFTIHEGKEFFILDQYNKWFRIGMPNGLSGWISIDNVGQINPL